MVPSRRLIRILAMILLGGMVAADSLAEIYFYPKAGVRCDRHQRLCYENDRPNPALTRIYFSGALKPVPSDAEPPHELADTRRACTVYSGERFRGEHLLLKTGKRYGYLGDDWNNAISSLIVGRDCVLRVFEDTDFRGRRSKFPAGRYAELGRNWQNKISSAECYCY